MKIGIDAKWYLQGPPSGKVVVRNIVDNLVKINAEDEIFLFLNRSDKKHLLSFNEPNVQIVFIPDINNALGNIFIIPFFAKRLNIDVVLYQNFATPFGKHKKISFIHDALYYDYPQYYSWLERIYLAPIKYLSKYCDRIITISNSEKERLIKHKFLQPDRISVVYHGIDLSLETRHNNSQEEFLTNKYKLPKDFIMYLGRLNVRKNIGNLLQSLVHLEQDIPLVIVGKVDKKMFDLDIILRELNLEHRVILLGHVPDEDLQYLYSKAKIFCFPSFAEGFGLPPLEAMATGTPTIVSNTTSLPEICGDAALYIDPSNAIDIADKINHFLTDKTLYDEKSKLGKERAKQFRWAKSAQKIWLLLKSSSE